MASNKSVDAKGAKVKREIAKEYSNRDKTGQN
jgi:hypothetical protein